MSRYYGGKKIGTRYYGEKIITAAYRGLKLIWKSISSCFGGGYWNNDEPWDNNDSWNNG